MNHKYSMKKWKWYLINFQRKVDLFVAKLVKLVVNEKLVRLLVAQRIQWFKLQVKSSNVFE